MSARRLKAARLAVLVERVEEFGHGAGDGAATARRFQETFARAVRGHWGVENNLHWIMDVGFREDQSRARTGYAAENLATLRRLALNLLKREKTKKRGIRAKQLNAGWDHAYLLRLVGI
jgi:hypothetical protein